MARPYNVSFSLCPLCLCGEITRDNYANPCTSSLKSSADAAAAPEAIFALIERLLDAPAPNNSCLLPGAVGEVIREIAAELGLPCAEIGTTGNLGIELGEPGAPLDLLLTAHMDRPCFRAPAVAERSLVPLCAIRVPGADYRCGGIGLRYIDGAVRISARGQLRFRRGEGGTHISFQPDDGELLPGDTVMMHAAPVLRNGLIRGAGLDNALGVAISLLSAAMLRRYAADVLRGRRLIFAFTDQEEGPPSGLFGQGAARLSHALPPPRMGFINIDGHNADAAVGHVSGVGASHAFVSGEGRGSVVPLDYQARADSLAERVNRLRPGTVRLNTSYVSRSDDMLLAAWSRPLGLTGVIVANAHTTEETAALGDVAAAVCWLAVFVSQVMSGA